MDLLGETMMSELVGKLCRLITTLPLGNSLKQKALKRKLQFVLLSM